MGYGSKCDEMEGVRAANGVGRSPAGSRYRRELGLCIGRFVFPWFYSFGVLMSEQRRSSRYALPDGTNHIIQYIYIYIC